MSDSDEFSTYQAAKAFTLNGSRLYNPGDVIPKSLVDASIISADDVAAQDEYAAFDGTEIDIGDYQYAAIMAIPAVVAEEQGDSESIMAFTTEATVEVNDE